MVRNNLLMMKSPVTHDDSFMIKQLPTPTVFINKEFIIVHASDKLKSIMQPDGGEISGISIFKFFPEVSTKWKKVLQDCVNGNNKPLGIQKSISEHKTECWFEWLTTPWYDENENVKGAIIQLNDITDSLEKEVELNKKDILLKQQSEFSTIGRWEYDLQKNSLNWCLNTKAIHEVRPQYVPNVETALYFYKEGYDRNAISMALFEATDKGTPYSLKSKIITEKGYEKWVQTCGKPIYNRGELVGLIGTFQDITNQVEADNKSINNEKLLRTLIDNLPVNVYIKDTESRKILANKTEYEYLGYKAEEDVLGKTDYELYPSESAKRSREEDLKVMSSLKPIIGKETLNTTKEGKQTSFLSSKIPLLDHNGVAYGLVGISLDITNLKQKENELRNLINIASSQNKKLLNFAHIVSHNLRSHSANFSMLLEFLKTEADPEEKKRILSMLTDASDNLLETLDNLNDVLAINTNNNLEKTEINLRDKVIQVQQNLSGFLLNNKTRIQNTIPDNFIIKSVPSYLESILINLITNAVKYKDETRPPFIKLTAEKTSKYTILSVTDNGLGIDLDKHGKKLFGMYKTFHNHKDAKGIGLYISKNQIEAMKGKIEVNSTLGKGTEFKIFFNEQD